VEIDSPEHEPTILYLPQPKYLNSCTYAASGIKLKDIPIICEYPDVFPDDLPELQPGTPLSLRDPTVCLLMSWLS
jgi:hypothetical protein